MVQPKFQTNSKVEVAHNQLSIKRENGGNCNWFWNTVYNTFHLVFVLVLLATLVDLMVNGNLVPAFDQISSHFNDTGIQLDAIVNCFLWISVVVLIMEATLHVHICSDLWRYRHMQIRHAAIPILFELAHGWIQMTLIFLVMEGLVLLRMFEFYLPRQLFTLFMAHLCSGLVVCSYLKKLQIARLTGYQQQESGSNSSPV